MSKLKLSSNRLWAGFGVLAVFLLVFAASVVGTGPSSPKDGAIQWSDWFAYDSSGAEVDVSFEPASESFVRGERGDYGAYSKAYSLVGNIGDAVISPKDPESFFKDGERKIRVRYSPTLVPGNEIPWETASGGELPVPHSDVLSDVFFKNIATNFTAKPSLPIKAGLKVSEDFAYLAQTRDFRSGTHIRRSLIFVRYEVTSGGETLAKGVLPCAIRPQLGFAQRMAVWYRRVVVRPFTQNFLDSSTTPEPPPSIPDSISRAHVAGLERIKPLASYNNRERLSQYRELLSGQISTLQASKPLLAEKGVEESAIEEYLGDLVSHKASLRPHPRWYYLRNGLLITIEVALCSVILGAILGFIVAVIRSTHDKHGRLAVLNAISKVYLTVIRGTPMTVQLMIAFFVIFATSNNKTLVAIIAFGVNSGAYVAEIMRAGITSIDDGQMEAGRSLGLSYLQSMRHIILPQAFRNVLPALGNEFIVLLKDTSIASFIALQDLSKGATIIQSQTYEFFMPWIMVAAVYLVLVMFFTWLLGKLERHLRNTGAQEL